MCSLRQRYDTDSLFNDWMDGDTFREYVQWFSVALIYVEYYNDSNAQIAFKRGFPLNSNLYKPLHQKET